MDVESDTARRALARWDAFPVDREPRPIVFTAAWPQWFERVSAELQASGALDDPALPEAVLTDEQVTAYFKYPLNVRAAQPRPLGRIVRMPMRFATDRGDRRIPAIVAVPEGRQQSLVALEPEVEERVAWSPPGPKPVEEHFSSTLAEDGHCLTYRFLGPVSNSYDSAVAIETPTAVLIEPLRRPPAEGYLDAPAALRCHEVAVRLAAPLGNRVLVSRGYPHLPDTIGSPLAVLPASYPLRPYERGD